MFRRGLSLLRSTGNALYRLVQDTYFVRLLIMTAKLWRQSWLLALLLTVALVLCLLVAGISARNAFELLRTWSVFSVLAFIGAPLFGCLVLEGCSALVMALLRAILRLAYDTDRGAIGTLLIMLAIGMTALAGLELAGGGGRHVAVLGVPVMAVAAATLIALSVWFQRTYRRPAYPGFRDFWVDVVDARHVMKRAAYGD